MSGPPKTPSHLRLVRGNPSKRPINKDEPKPPKGVPPTPKHFDKQGKYWFKRLGDQLAGIGVLTELDGKALEMLVDAYVESREARKEVRGWLQEFGMTPASRSKVSVRKSEDDDPLAEFMKARD